MVKYKLTIVVDVESESRDSMSVHADAMGNIVTCGLSENDNYGVATIKRYQSQIEMVED